MNEYINQVSQALLTPAGISIEEILPIIGDMRTNGCDFADIYLQSSAAEMWMLEEGIVKEGSFDIEAGFGVRSLLGEQAGYAHADVFDLEQMQIAAKSANSIVNSSSTAKIALPTLTPITAAAQYASIDPIASLGEVDKVTLLQKADKVARAQDPRVKQVVISLSGRFEQVLIINSDGDICADIRPLVRFNINVIVEQNGRRESASSGGGRRSGYQYFDDDVIEHHAKEAVRMALVNLEATPTPAGEMPVVLGPGWPGVLLHEAIGHGLEGDFNRKGSSSFSGRMGQKIASDLCTVVDDGTIEGRRGSLSVDDEGTPSECTVLIENGVLKNYMQDKLNAKLMNTRSTGNGRRESYTDLPMPRMRNTYMQPGKSNPEEIIKSVKKGLYAVNFAGGQVDITSGSFVFCMSEAYMIEDGKISYPVKDATLVGDGPEILQRVSMVANDLKLDEGVGTCGKDGQSVPVGVGQPTLLIDRITVGGTTQHA